MTAAIVPVASRGWRARFARSEAARGYALLSPVLLVMLGAMAAPVLMLMAYSFWTQTGLVLDTTFTLDRYGEVLARESYRTLFWRSIGISGLVTLVTVLTAYPIAYYVAFYVAKRKFVWLVLLTIPFWTSYLLRVFAWRVILGYDGVLNSTLLTLGLIEQPLTFILYNRTAVVITLAHAWAAFAILPIYVSLEKVDRTLLEAAADLGDGPTRRFFRITLPLTMPGVIAAAVLIFVPTTGDYVTPSLVGGTDGVMLANLIQIQFGRTNNWPLGAALAILSLAAVALIVMLAVAALRFLTARIK